MDVGLDVPHHHERGFAPRRHDGDVALDPSDCWGEGFRNLYVTAGKSVYKMAAKVNGTRTF